MACYPRYHDLFKDLNCKIIHKIDNDKFVDDIKSGAHKIGSADYSAGSCKAWKSSICQRVLQMMHISGHKTQKTFMDNIKLSSEEIADEIASMSKNKNFRSISIPKKWTNDRFSE